jgi:hypothetical protein
MIQLLIDKSIALSSGRRRNRSPGKEEARR